MLNILRIYHAFEGRVEKFFPRISDCHHEARDPCTKCQMSINLRNIWSSGIAHIPGSHKPIHCTVLPAKSESEIMFCLQSYHGLRIDRSLVY